MNITIPDKSTGQQFTAEEFNQVKSVVNGKANAGEVGVKGDKGDTGATGSQGPKGDTGATGPQGPKGDTGLSGSKGDTGATGPKGDTGAAGAVGATGPKGDKGDTGTAGADGADGLGVPAGGSAGQILAKVTNADNDTHWINAPSGGGGSSEPSGQIKSFKVDYAAVGDGVTDDTAAINAALAAERVIEDSGDFFVSSIPVNKYGTKIQGDVRILRNSPNGNAVKQQLNSYADVNQHVFGTEYLSSFHKKLKANMTASTPTPIKIVFTGDSTTYGGNDGADTAIDQAVTFLINRDYIPAINCINSSHSGGTAQTWLSNWLADDLALNPDVLVIRWGINDMAYITPQQLVDTMDSALSTIRANSSFTKDKLAIVLCSQNATTDDNAGHKGEIFCEELNKGLRVLARKYACCYLDLYALWQDVRQGQDYFTPNDVSRPNELLHPGRTLKILIACKTYDVLFPEYFRGKSVIDLGATGRLASASPLTYRAGITYEYVDSANGYPTTGFCTTHRMDAGGSFVLFRQEITVFTGSTNANKVYVRTGWGAGAGTWMDWYILEPLKTQVAYLGSNDGSILPNKVWSTYPEGISLDIVYASAGWPVDGILTTRKYNGYINQTLISSAGNREFVRGYYQALGTFKEVTLT